MRALQESLTLSSLSNSTIASPSLSSGPRFYDWLFECHGFWHNVALIIPSLLFVLYLSFQARKSFSKLSHGRSYVIIAYYACLWLVSLFNLIWCCFQVLAFAIIDYLNKFVIVVVFSIYCLLVFGSWKLLSFLGFYLGFLHIFRFSYLQLNFGRVYNPRLPSWIWKTELCWFPFGFLCTIGFSY